MTAKEIIARSILMHPSLFREALDNQSITHREYAHLTADKRAAQGAAASFTACRLAFDWIGQSDLSEEERATHICADCGTMVIALNVACKLQCIPPHIRTAAAVDWQETQDD